MKILHSCSSTESLVACRWQPSHHVKLFCTHAEQPEWTPLPFHSENLLHDAHIFRPINGAVRLSYSGTLLCSADIAVRKSSAGCTNGAIHEKPSHCEWLRCYLRTRDMDYSHFSRDLEESSPFILFLHPWDVRSFADDHWETTGYRLMQFSWIRAHFELFCFELLETTARV